MTEASSQSGAHVMQPVLSRLQDLGRCSAGLEAQVLAMGGRIEAVAARTVVWSDDAVAHRPRFLLSGWACRSRSLSDGRRQIFEIVLPGDGIGLHPHTQPPLGTSIRALTPLRLVDASALVMDDHEVDGLPLTRVQAGAAEERACRQIMRLGRMTALERLTDLFRELHERLEIVGQTDHGRFVFPLTQDTLADLTGLSVVHVNRTLQALRSRGSIMIERGWVQLCDAPRRPSNGAAVPRQLAS